MNVIELLFKYSFKFSLKEVIIVEVKRITQLEKKGLLEYYSIAQL